MFPYLAQVADTRGIVCEAPAEGRYASAGAEPKDAPGRQER